MTRRRTNSKANNAISTEQIEMINSYGPYDHSTWISNNVEITNEARLRGRGGFILKRMRESILKHFTLDEIKNLSILDVGCYDGWILHNLSDLPFRKLVGVEPREKNIIKGQKVREFLNIKSTVQFKIGDIQSLGNEKFDIVLCTGLLHHLESPSDVIRRLRSVCRKMLFIETICLSSKHITKAFRKEIEMKDLIYLYKNQICGITGQKFESSYYDGSINKTSVISIPSVESLIMYLDIQGFEEIEIVADPKSYKAAVWKNDRPFNAVCISALVGNDEKGSILDESSWVQEYEMGLANTIIKKSYIVPLYRFFRFRKITLRRPIFFLNTLLYIYSPNRLSNWFRYFTKLWFTNRYALEIIKNLRFNPADKLGLEYGKVLYKEQNYREAISVLKDVTQKVNADWRSIYRSFYLISKIYKEMGLIDESERYKALCLTCNPKFPID